MVAAQRAKLRRILQSRDISNHSCLLAGNRDDSALSVVARLEKKLLPGVDEMLGEDTWADPDTYSEDDDEVSAILWPVNLSLTLSFLLLLPPPPLFYFILVVSVARFLAGAICW